jgi:hypothetical protein
MKHLATNALDALFTAFHVLRLLFGGAPPRLAERVNAQTRAIRLRLTLPVGISEDEALEIWLFARAAHEQGATVTTGHLQRLVPDLSQEGAARLLSWLCQSNPGAWTTVSFLPLPNGGFAAAVIEPSEPMAEAGEGQDG